MIDRHRWVLIDAGAHNRPWILERRPVYAMTLAFLEFTRGLR
jgi:hypothetical protein